MAGQGTKILASDYNAIQTVIGGVVGPATSSSGYGQNVNSAQISGPNYGKITALQWNNLQTDITNAYIHVSNTNPNLTIASNGATFVATAITSTSTTITVTTAPYFTTWPTGMSVTISGATPSGYNGTWTIVGVSTTQFTITNTSNFGTASIPGVITTPQVKIRESDRVAYATAAAYCATHAFDTPVTAQATTQVLTTGTKTTSWNNTITHTVVLKWASQAAARAFFNTGSQIQIKGSLTNIPTDASTAKDNDWATLLTNLGTVSIGYNSTTGTGTYTSIASSSGYYQLNSTPLTVVSKATPLSSTYTPNEYDILASLDGTGTILTLTIKFQDLSTFTNTTIYNGVGGPHGPFGIDENVTGTLTSIVQAYYASGRVSALQYLPAVDSTSGPA